MRIINAGLVLILFLIFSTPLSYLGFLYHLSRLTTNIMFPAGEINISESFKEQNIDYYEFFMHYLPEDFYPNGLTREELLKLLSRATLKTGVISSDETWRGVILITGDLQVDKEVTLTVEPGTIIFIAAHCDDQHSGMPMDVDPVNPHEFQGRDYEFSHISIRIYGTILAVGTPNNPIIITSNSTKPTLWDWQDLLIWNGTIQYAIIEYGWGIGVESSSVVISHCVIRKMLQQGIKMGFGNSRKGISPAIIYNFIYDVGHGPVQADNCSPYIAHNVFIQRRTKNPKLYEYLSKGENPGINIKGNSIIEHNLIVSGHTPNWEKGLLVAGGIGTALTLEGNSTVRFNTIIDSDCAFEIFGGSSTINYNNIYGISDFFMWVHTIREEPGKPREKMIYAEAIDASNNWWGMMSVSAIYQKIKIEDKIIAVNLNPIAKTKLSDALPDWREFKWLFQSHIIKVPDDYATIQEAISAAKPGDTIIVSPGIYHENIIIDKSISLIGKIRENTIIDGSGLGDVICISSSGVKISNLTVTNSGNRYKGPFDGGNNAGVKLKYVNNCIISRLIVTNNTNGISIISSNSNVISDNLVFSNNKEGIFVISSSNNLIVNNTSNLNGAHGGIWLAFSTNNVIISNTASHNLFDHGIKLHTSNNNLVKNNICEDNYNAGIFLLHSNNNILVGNLCSGNKHNPGIILHIQNNNNTIINNICNSNDEGIVLQYSSNNNIIANNTCMNNKARGIGVMWFSDNNTITSNMLSLNGEGIWIEDSSHNKIHHNHILNNWRGIVILGEKSSGNEIHWNNIMGNVEWGLLNEAPMDVNATLNWWGSQYGPQICQFVEETDQIDPEEIRGKISYEPWLMGPCALTTGIEGKIPTIINITTELEKVDVGEEVLIKGRLSPAMAVPIRLEIERPDGTTETMTTTSTSEGTFSFNVKLDKEGTWKFRAAFDGDLTHEASVSNCVSARAQQPSYLHPWFTIAIIIVIVIIGAITAAVKIKKKKRRA